MQEYVTATREIVATPTPAQHATPFPHQLITEGELATFLRVDPRTVRRLEQSGELPRAKRFGGCKRWDANEIGDWLEKDKGGLRQTA